MRNDNFFSFMYAGFVASTTPYFLCQARQPKPFNTSDQKERFTARSGHQTYAIFFCCCHLSCTTYSGQRWMLGMQWPATPSWRTHPLLLLVSAFPCWSGTLCTGNLAIQQMSCSCWTPWGVPSWINAPGCSPSSTARG